jgi:LuxR family transcriptional regulator, maltose regulon positive regulatory protein
VSSLGLLALARLTEGDAAQADELASSASRVTREGGLGEYWVSAPAHLARGASLLRGGRIPEASTELERGLELARRGSGPVDTVHGLVVLAQARAQDGDREQARELLLEARWMIDACPDPGLVATGVLEKEERRLRVSRPATGSTSPEEFSDREIAVLRLLSGDLSQRARTTASARCDTFSLR